MALPSEYRRLDYIESTGTQCINTLIYQKYSEKVKIEFNFTPAELSGYFGGNGTTQCQINSTNGFATNSNATCEILHTANSSTTITTNGVLKNTFTFSGYDNLPIALFALGMGNSSYSYYVKGKLYYAKVWDKDDALIRDFVPALWVLDSKPGLYDLVTDTFYTNSGTGEFSYGSIVSDTPNIFFEDNPLVIDVGGEALLTANFERAASLRYKVNGVWKYAIPYIKLNGNWYKAIAYRKTNGVWKQGI